MCGFFAQSQIREEYLDYLAEEADRDSVPSERGDEVEALGEQTKSIAYPSFS